MVHFVEDKLRIDLKIMRKSTFNLVFHYLMPLLSLLANVNEVVVMCLYLSFRPARNV